MPSSSSSKSSSKTSSNKSMVAAAVVSTTTDDAKDIDDRHQQQQVVDHDKQQQQHQEQQQQQEIEQSTPRLPPPSSEGVEVEDFEVTYAEHRQQVSGSLLTSPSSPSEPPLPPRRSFGRFHRRSASGAGAGVGVGGRNNKNHNNNNNNNNSSSGSSNISSSEDIQNKRLQLQKQNFHHRRSYSLGNTPASLANQKNNNNGRTESSGSSFGAAFFADISIGNNGNNNNGSSGGGGNGGGEGGDGTDGSNGKGGFFSIVPMNPFEAGNALQDDTAASVGDDASLILKTISVPDALSGHDLTTSLPDLIIAFQNCDEDNDNNNFNDDDINIDDDLNDNNDLSFSSMKSPGGITEVSAGQHDGNKAADRLERFESTQKEDEKEQETTHRSVDSTTFSDIEEGNRSSGTATKNNKVTFDVSPETANDDNGDDARGVSGSTSGSGSERKQVSRSVLTAGIESFKYLYSTALLIFCVVLVMGAIFTQQTTLTATTTNTNVTNTNSTDTENTDSLSEANEIGGLPPIGAFFIFWFLIIWLAFLEGGQGALVGLQPIDRKSYKDSHPRSYKNTRLVHGKMLDRFIVGRQFLVVLVVFVMQLMSSAVSDIQLWGLSPQVTEIFLKSGLALIVVTIVLGQLTAQLNAATCMLDFINNYFMLYFVSYLSLAIEFSGLLHSVYLVQWIFEKITKKDNRKPSTDDENLKSSVDIKEEIGNVTSSSSDEEIGVALTVGPQEEASSDDVSVETVKMPKCQVFFFVLRVVMSLAVLSFAFSVTLAALFQGKTTMWEGVPAAASVAIFFLLMVVVGLMEGAQIALFSVVNSSQEKLADEHPIAYRNCDLAFRDDNLPAFLIGRQICVTICTFVIARITTLDVEDGGNIFGVSDGMQAFFNTGLLGAVITTIVASLAWRIVANAFPIAFLSNPLITPMIRLCLLLEASGICASAWVSARLQRQIVRYQPDDSYLNKESAEGSRTETLSNRDRDIDRFVNVSKYTISLALLVFSVILLSCSIFTQQTNLTSASETGGKEFPPVVAFILLIVLIIWLNFLEGAQGSIIGLQNVDKMKYAESHPRAFRSISVSQRGDNLQRFIVGRQFLVLTVIFLSQWITSPLSGVSVLGLPTIVNEIFLSSGLALMLTVIMVGQLAGEVNAATCMLDFINNYFTEYFVTYLSILVEQTGLLHSVYLFQIVFSKIAGQPIKSREQQRSARHKFFFWLRVCLSLVALAFALAVTLDGLLRQKTTIWIDIPAAAAVVIFFVLIIFVGLLEGLQLAIFSVTGNEDELVTRRMAYANYALTFSDLQSVLIGRQILVTISFFVIARITTLNVNIGHDDNIFGVSNAAQGFFNTGTLAALISTILASLTWRLIASSFPVLFMANPFINLIIRFCRVVNDSGLCCASWMLGRWTKVAIGYQPDEVYLDGAKREGAEPITRRDKDIDVTVSLIKYIFSTGLLVFAVAVTASLIITQQTELSENTHPAFALILLIFLLGWLGMMEGGQGCLVGIQGIPPKLYASSHPKTFKNAIIAHRGNNMARFIIGRQFLVVLVVFIINLCGSPMDGSGVFGLPDVANAIFVNSNLSLILITVIIGQLMAQVNAASCMLDFINSYFMLYCVTYVSLAIEWSGLLHSVYLIQILFVKLSGAQDESKETPRTKVQAAFFWARVVLSLAILAFSLSVTLTALVDGKTTAWEGVPGGVSIVIFFVLMILAGLLEGMQISLFAVVHVSQEELGKSKLAKAVCQLTFTGNNLSRFLIGRQILVTLCTFVIAQITTLNVVVADGDNIFGVPDGLQEFFNTGLLGAIITTIIGSLIWRVIAASFPIAFIGNPVIYLLLRLCLLLQATGVCASALLLALVNKQIAGFQPDEKYIGRKEDWETNASDDKINDPDGTKKSGSSGREREKS